MSASTTSRPSGSVGIGVLTSCLALAGWTSIPLFLKYFAKDIDPYTANGWRYGFSALLWLPALLWAWRRSSMPPGIWRAAIVPSIFNTIAQYAFGIAPYKMDPGLMTFSLRAQVIFVTIGAAIMFVSERRVIWTPAYLLGLIMVVSGTTLTLILKQGGLKGPTAEGVMWAVIAGVCYAAYALSVRKYMFGINPLLAFAAVSQYTAGALIVVMLAWGKNHGADAWMLSNWKFGLLLLSAVIGIGLGHTCYFLAIQRLGLAVANGIVQLQPITVSFASMWMFNEQFTHAQWITGTVAVCGAGFILWAQTHANKGQPTVAAPALPVAVPQAE